MPPHNTLTPKFSDYAERALVVIPEIDTVPLKGLQWSRYYRDKVKPTQEEIATWDRLKSYGQGLVTGEPSNIIGVDFDYATPEQTAAVIDYIGDSPCKKFGSKGFTGFYKYNGEKNYQWEKDGKVLIEVLSTGKKSTLPPSIHANTREPYQWIGKPLIECYHILPSLPADYIVVLNDILSIAPEIEREYIRDDYEVRPSYNDAVEALNCCNPSCTNDEWIKIGMSFKAEVGDAGFQAFNDWSSKGKGYDKHDIRTRWRSFNSHSITYGTLIHFAKLGGYKPPRRESNGTIRKVSVEDWEKEKLTRKLLVVEGSETMPEFYSKAPYHIKEVCDWIIGTSLHPQPMITLGSVLGFFGFVMGKDFEFNSLKTNLYVANIAYSADGKEHVNRCIRGLLTELNLQDLISYGWTSDTSIINDLTKNNGRTFYLTDELQSALRSIKNRSTNSSEGRAVDCLLQAYTGVDVRTVTKADMKTNPTLIVKNPLLTICGYTTPYMFETCLSSAEVFSGFVGRLTAFRGNKFIPPENDNFDGKAYKNIPEDIKLIIKNILINRHKVIHPDGTFTAGMKEISTNCLPLIKEYREQIRNKRNKLRAENNPAEVIMGRAAEVMLKYAMIASRGDEILPEHIYWAISLVEYNLSIMFAVAENFVETKFEGKKQKVVQFMEKRGGSIEKSELSQGCRIFDSSRERIDTLTDLINAGIIEEFSIEGVGAKSRTAYRIL